MAMQISSVVRLEQRRIVNRYREPGFPFLFLPEKKRTAAAVSQDLERDMKGGRQSEQQLVVVVPEYLGQRIRLVSLMSNPSL